MKALSILMVVFVISCAGTTIKKPGIKPPVLSKKQIRVLKEFLNAGIAVGGAVITGTFKDGLLFKVIK